MKWYIFLKFLSGKIEIVDMKIEGFNFKKMMDFYKMDRRVDLMVIFIVRFEESSRGLVVLENVGSSVLWWGITEFLKDVVVLDWEGFINLIISNWGFEEWIRFSR